MIMLRSEEVRKLAPEMDPLRMGMGWKVSDLSKPQVMVESSYGDSHPGSAHLNIFVEEAVKAVDENGGKAARYFATDMCDGIAQGHDGINYSLAHRDAITNLVEAQANATVFDGGVFIASCDKSMPAMLMSIGRLKDMSAIVVTGGVMEAHELRRNMWWTILPAGSMSSLLWNRLVNSMPGRRRESSPMNSWIIISSMPAPAAERAPLWARRPPCRSWRRLWD